MSRGISTVAVLESVEGVNPFLTGLQPSPTTPKEFSAMKLQEGIILASSGKTTRGECPESEIDKENKLQQQRTLDRVLERAQLNKVSHTSLTHSLDQF